MLFELTNEQRYYLGLTQVHKSWERIEFDENTYLYFHDDKLVKIINVSENMYYESELNETTAENRTLILPKTSKGKIRKLNQTALRSLRGIGVYFYFGNGDIQISNFTTQTTFFSSRWGEEKIDNLEGMQKWLNWWISDTTANDINDIELFKLSTRQHCKYREGDFFAFKTGRRQYGFGRILLVIAPIRKAVEEGKVDEKHYGLMNLMGKALVIKVYKITSDTTDMDLNELKQCEAFLSQYIMDNVFYYGEYKILENLPLEPFELEFPVSYSRSINALDKDTVYLQYGLIYKETHISKYSKYLTDPNNEFMGVNNPFRNSSIGFYVDTSPYHMELDLRSLHNANIKHEIFDFFGLDANKSYYENYLEYQHTK
ncbi:MAG: immunity 26/phosphotriesterase HocA family protein [Coriobacteriia bacterium]|nr:immunity 26/phosphotriesterase HocA family protein [Coriobacteriia bacterium]